jgi:hypothetical protein
VESLAREEIIKELKTEWKKLWWERIDDKIRAEGIANRDFSMLFVDKGTVISATRNFRMLNFREILELHNVVDADRVIPSSPQVGGWGKFIRTEIASQKPPKRTGRIQQYRDGEKQRQQLKKGGRGWLHFETH